MSTSTDAILFYGYCWHEEARLLPCDENGTHLEDWPTILLRKRGVKNPWDDRPDFSDNPYQEMCRLHDEWVVENKPALEVWWAEEKKLEEEIGCEIGWHCSDSCPMPYVFIKKSEKIAYRGHPVEVNPYEDMVVSCLWSDKLRQFTEELGITPPQEMPSWWLVSYWG